MTSATDAPVQTREGFGDPGHPADTCAEDSCPGVPNPDQTTVGTGDIDCSGDINVLDAPGMVHVVPGIGTCP